MSIIRVTTSFNLDIDFEAPPFHRRLFAWMIDLFILMFYIIIASKILKKVERYMDYSDYNMYNMWAVCLLLVLSFILYHSVSDILITGRSVRKRLMYIQGINEYGD